MFWSNHQGWGPGWTATDSWAEVSTSSVSCSSEWTSCVQTLSQVSTLIDNLPLKYNQISLKKLFMRNNFQRVKVDLIPESHRDTRQERSTLLHEYHSQRTGCGHQDLQSWSGKYHESSPCLWCRCYQATGQIWWVKKV